MTDRFGRNIHYLRLSVTDRCNLNCRYCMPNEVPHLAHSDILSYEELVRLAGLFAHCGFDTIRLTGGEPLVRRDVEKLTAMLHGVPGIRRLALTTNGLLLAEKLPALQAAGLNAVNISLDTLKPETFRLLTGHDGLELTLKAIEAALAAGLAVKLNCVPLQGVNDGELADIAQLAQSRPLSVRFIELMPIGGPQNLKGVSGTEVQKRLAERWPDMQPQADDGRGGSGPAQYYHIPGWEGSIGFISALSCGFCARCTRMRLSATGILRPCLGYDDGTELGALLRGGASDEELLAAIEQAVAAKPAAHSFGERSPQGGMYRIGG